MQPATVPTHVRFAFPFAVLTKPNVVRLVAGEEFRYTLTSPALEQWLPQFLAGFEREVEWRPLVEQLPMERRQQAMEIVTRLYGERALLEGGGPRPPDASGFRWVVAEEGRLGAQLRAMTPPASAGAIDIPILCQDALDYAAALDFNRRCLRSNAAGWLWVSSGAMGRGFVSPIFRPGAGPCLGCMIRNFQRLSPAPEIYQHLIEHSCAGGAIPPVPFPAAGLDMLAALARWKVESLAQPEPPAGIYQLHVLEVSNMECTTHRVFRDPHCPDCSRT
jgi:bacteriocin biosynthesis cyclodehydratase domain-containing protein